MIATGRYADASVRDLTRVGRVDEPQSRCGHRELREAWSSLRADGSGDDRGSSRQRMRSKTVVKVEKFTENQPDQLPSRRDPRLQPGGLQHRSMPRHAHRQRRIQAQLAGIPARSRLYDARPRFRRAEGFAPFSPRSSLLLTKPLGEVAHEGGLKLDRTTKTYEYLRDWIAEGCPRRLDSAPTAVKLEIVPGAARFERPDAVTQQIALQVHYSDGSRRDVTPICYYSASSPEIAEVDRDRVRQIQEQAGKWQSSPTISTWSPPSA